MAKTTKKHFKIFKDECLRLQKEWGLGGWELYFKFHKVGETGAFGTIRCSLEHKNATILLTRDWPTETRPLNKEELKRTAKHEMIHLVINRLYILAMNRFCTELELKEANEEMVNILMKIT